MANITSNALFIVSALVFAVGLLFIAYPYLTSTLILLCAVGYTSYCHSPALHRHYVYVTSVLWPAACENHLPVGSSSFGSNLLGGADLPSPIPHVSSGLETVKNRRSSADEIVSSTPRNTPTNSHGSSSSAYFQPQMRPSPDTVAPDSRQLNFRKITTPKASRTQLQDVHQNHSDLILNQKTQTRAGGGKTVQTMAGPLLRSTRYNPSYDAGIFVNVNSPGFTDRLVRCANDNSGLNWRHGSPAAQQDRYNSVGLFPIVHLNSHAPPSLSARNSQKVPNSNVRVRIAPPVYTDSRQHCMRGSNIQIQPYIPTRETIRRNDVAKSVLESLQEASRKRIYSQCQEVLDDDSGKKRQRKGDSALPNPNCDMYQYRNIRAPSVPSNMAATAHGDIHHQVKRVHDDPLSRTNEPKRQRQHAKPHPANNEISSSLSSSKTLLQQLNGNKRKADYEYSEGNNGKHFKESPNASEPSHSRWLHSRPCDEGESAARTQEVVRSQRKSPTSPSPGAAKILLQKNKATSEKPSSGTLPNITPCRERETATMEKESEKPEKVEIDLTSKLFRKEIVSRSQPKSTLPGKKSSSWTQMPPDADERCLHEQGDSSELDRPERFQSLLSRMSGQDVSSVKNASHTVAQPILEPPKSCSSSTTLVDSGKLDSNKTSTLTIPSTSIPVTFSSLSTPVSNAVSMTESSPASSQSQMAASAAVVPAVSPPLLFTANTSVPQQSNSNTLTSSTTFATVERSGEGKQDQTDGLTVSAPTKSIAVLTPSSKPMFRYESPSSPRPLALKSNSPVVPSGSQTSDTNSVPLAQPAFQFNSISQLTPDTESSNQVVDPPLSFMKPLPSTLDESKNKPAQSIGFSFLPVSTSSSVVPASTNEKPAISVNDAAKITMPIPKPQFSFGSGSSALSQHKPDASSSSNLLVPTSAPSIFSTSPNKSVAPAASLNRGDQKNFGGFQFSASSGSLFGQSAARGAAPVSSFSFTATSTAITSQTPDKVTSLNSVITSDLKAGSGSGSITFGTVMAVATETTSSTAFSLPVSSTGNSSSVESLKPPFQMSSLGTNAVSAKSGFSNSSQGIFNGFSSWPNTTTLAVPSFGGSLQQSPSQSQNRGNGGFSFGGSLGQPPSSVAFGAVAPTSSRMFGNVTVPQPTFGAPTTVSGFAVQSAGPTFSNSSFGSSTSLTFGSSQPSNPSPFGEQTATNNPPTFSMSSSNPPAFGNSSATSLGQSFGTTSPPSYGVSPSAQPSFGANSASAPVPNINSAFTFGSSTDKPTVPAYNFGGNNAAPAPAFSFGSGELQQQQQSSSGALFQFGQTASPSAAPAFQFGSPSAQPGVFSFGASSPSFGTLGGFTIGSGSFSMGSGPTTPQRSRSLQNRRRRI